MCYLFLTKKIARICQNYYKKDCAQTRVYVSDDGFADLQQVLEALQTTIRSVLQVACAVGDRPSQVKTERDLVQPRAHGETYGSITMRNDGRVIVGRMLCGAKR